MMLHLTPPHLPFATPRLMPFTIAALAAVLAVKTADLARLAADAAQTASAGMVTAAQAAAPPSPATPPAPSGAPGAQPPARPAATPAAQPGAPAFPTATQPPQISDSERAILLDLRQRREQLDQRAATLNARESLLAAAEQKLEARAQELTALQQRLQALEAARDQREEAGWQGLVKVYQDMKPRDAAAIFNDLQMPVLLAVLDRMKEMKAAAILAAMNPDKAREVTTGLAKLRTRRDAAAQAAPGGG